MARYVAMVLVGLGVSGCMSAAKYCGHYEEASPDRLMCEALVAQRNAAVSSQWVGIIGLAAALDNSGSSRH